MSASLSRRQILQALTVGGGLSAASGSVSPWLARTARAAEGATPKFVAVFYANGVPEVKTFAANTTKDFGMVSPYDGFAMPGSSSDVLRLGYYVKGFEGLEKHLVVLDGINGASKGDYHYGGMGEVLTNNNKGNSDLAASPSIDQFIAARTKLPPVLAGQTTFTDTVSFDAKGNPQTMQDSPGKVYDRVFASLKPGAPDAAAERRVRLRKSILDAVAKDVVTFTKRELPREARDRAEAQLTAIRDLERSLDQAATATCTPPQRQDVGAGGENTPLHSAAQARNIAAALACGVTQSAVLQFRSATQNGNGWAQNNFGRLKTTAGWHALSHDTANPRGQIEAIRYVLDTTRLLADELDKLKTPTGSLLDETIILLCTEISSGHTAQRLCWATVGGRKLGWKTAPSGRYVKFGNGTWAGGGAGIGQLHLSILRAMGHVDLKTFGRTDGDTYDGSKNTYYKNGHVGALETLIGV